MINFEVLNEAITNRIPSQDFDDKTYYNMKLFEHFCDNADYKYVAIFGYYKPKYSWTDIEALEMYNKAPDGWTDGLGVYRLYDWGRGDNRIECGDDWDWHKPQLDHIVAFTRAKKLGWADSEANHPNNFQVLPAIINRILSDMVDEHAPALLPVLIRQFPEVVLDGAVL